MPADTKKSLYVLFVKRNITIVIVVADILKKDALQPEKVLQKLDKKSSKRKKSSKFSNISDKIWSKG